MVITTVKDINGSPHIAIPADLLEQIQLPIGSSVSINIEGNQITIAKSAPHYSLDELLARMPDDLIQSSEDREWLEASPVGRQKRGESNLWQRRFWEHLIRNERDFALHCDYIHDNPVRHGLCKNPQDWPYSSIHRFIAQGIYPADWGKGERKEKPSGCWDD